ncbi:MAG: amino acid/amide transporter ATP-binding protein 1, family [Modestobacter sp.]|nr:amino acid/amide transporter ATP-binding protein 1, family [Modestobacter sp.]
MSLRADDLVRHFGGVVAVGGVSLEVQPGRVVGLVGPNGAGKTTCFNLLTGFLRPTSGRIFVDDRDISGLRPDQRVSVGVSRTFQQTTLFGGLSARDNVVLALHRNDREPWWRVALPVPGHTARLGRAAMEILERVGIAPVAALRADSLAYGDQRRLAIAVALGSAPRYVLMDEPAAGLNPRESAQLALLLGELRADGLGILIVEHDMPLIMSVADHVVVLTNGQQLAAGTPAEIRTDPEVVAAYLGRAA